MKKTTTAALNLAKVPVRGSDLRGYTRLAVDATLALTRLVETMHHNITRMPSVLGKATQQPTRGVTGFVYKSVRGITRLAGGSIDALLGSMAPSIGAGQSSPYREAVLAALNGVLGDHLSETSNPLAIPMSLRRGGQSLTLTRKSLSAAIPSPAGRILLLVHGLCMSDLQWRRNGHDHGAALAADLGFTPLYLHYNSGRHISTNGREFAEFIEALLHAWPVAVDELAIIGHSMGGLVARSACRYGAESGQAWLRHVSNIFFLGTPHLGAPLERAGSWIDAILDASPYSMAFARLGKIRSAGITDLRRGGLCDADWHGRDRFVRSQRYPQHVPLPRGIACHAFAASLGSASGTIIDRSIGDGLVPLDSALGQSKNTDRRLLFLKARRWIGYRMNHLDLLDCKEVYERIRRELDGTRSGSARLRAGRE
ncbi:MAG TPA: alpha/beta hydrolase [Burkholderiales bacterium]|nr:alpha/beta hydrolase [Burkholderiales bacterium]